MTPAFKLYNFVTKRTGADRKSRIEGLFVTTSAEIRNDYGTDRAPIAAGTTLCLKFGCDSGIYAMADVDATLQNVKVPLDEIHLIDWSKYQSEIDDG